MSVSKKEVPQPDHTFYPVEADSPLDRAVEAETTEKDAAFSNDRLNFGFNAVEVSEKQYSTFTENDFPNKTEGGGRGLNRLLKVYADVRSALFTNKSLGGDVEPVSCDNVFGLCGLLSFLLVHVAYVAYAIHRSGVQNVDVHLLWISALLWFVLLVKTARRLVRLGRHKGGCWAIFITLATVSNFLLNGCVRALTLPWRAFWAIFRLDESTLRKRKILVLKVLAATLMMAFTAFCVVYYVVLAEPKNLISLGGIAFLLLISVLLSKFPAKIIWHPVLVCLFLQLLFAFLTLKTHAGYWTFDFLGKRMAEFLENSKAGSRFVFGDLDCFAFTVLPIIIFFSSFMAVCFHLGIVQLIVDKPSAVASVILHTTGPETLNAIANIFVSMTEAPLITRPYLPLSTNSELHAMFVNGFASVSGSVLAAYISFGIASNHLLIACVISAPAALAISKILYPEVKVSPMAHTTVSVALKSSYHGVLEAAMVGAMDALPICGGLVANLIAYLSIYNFLNRVLIWLGNRVYLPFELTFEVIFSYILWPIAITMGVPMEDSKKVAELIGVKISLNEFTAFQRLGMIIRNSETLGDRNTSLPIDYLSNGDCGFTLNNGTYVVAPHGVLLTEKAVVISTYALCGFANVGSIGIFLATMVSILPHRRSDLTGMVLSGMIGGNIACFLTGCFAGLFFENRL